MTATAFFKKLMRKKFNKNSTVEFNSLVWTAHQGHVPDLIT